jgi:hypothetical protein
VPSVLTSGAALAAVGVKGWGGLETRQTRKDKQSENKTRQDKTRQNKTRQTRQGKTRQDKTRQEDNKTRPILTSEFAILTSELTNSFAFLR